RLAMFTCSFGSMSVSQYELVATKCRLLLENAFEYLGEMKSVAIIGDKEMEKTFKPGDQFAPELIYFSDCILNDRSPEPSGNEGLADVRVINAIYQSAKTGRTMRIEPVPKTRRPDRGLENKRAPVEQPKLIGASVPHS